MNQSTTDKPKERRNRLLRNVVMQGILIAIMAVAVVMLMHSRAKDDGLDADDVHELWGILGALPQSGLGIDKGFDVDHDAYILITAGAAYTKVYAVAPGILGDELENKLKRAASSTGINYKILPHGILREYSVMRLNEFHGRRGAASARNTVHVRELVSAIRSQGIGPHVLLRIPNYASSSRIDLPEQKRPRYNWYNATNSPRNLLVTVNARAPHSFLLLIYYLKFFLPGLALLGFVGGIAMLANRRMTPRRRVDIYDILSGWVPLACGLVAVATAFVLKKSEFARLAADIWYGNSAYDMVFDAVFIGAVIALFVLPVLSCVLRRPLCRKFDEEPESLNVEIISRRLRQCLIAQALLVTGLFIYIMVARPYEILGWSRLSSLLPALSGFWVPIITLKPLLARFKPNHPDSELTRRAQELATLMGVELREVRVAESDYAKRNPNAFAYLRKKSIIVTRKALDVMSPAQLDSLLAHELAHFRQISIFRGSIWPASAIKLACALLIIAPMGLDMYTRSMFAVLVAGILPISCVIDLYQLTALRHALEYDADINGMLATRNLSAAISSLKTAVLNSQNPKIHDMELDEHPKTSKRIKALRLAAAQAGIEEQPEELEHLDTGSCDVQETSKTD